MHTTGLGILATLELIVRGCVEQYVAVCRKGGVVVGSADRLYVKNKVVACGYVYVSNRKICSTRNGLRCFNSVYADVFIVGYI